MASHHRQRRPILPLCFSVKLLSDCTSLSRKRIYQAIALGELETRRIGAKRVIDLIAALDWLRSFPKG